MRYATLVTVLMLAGCISGNYTPVIRYVVDPEPDLPQVQPSGKSIGIRPLEPLMPYKQRIVYRTVDYRVGYSDTAEWAEMPRDTLTRALTDALAASQRFGDVGNASDLRDPDYVLTGQLRKFDEDRTTDPWNAVCEIRLELRQGFERDAAWAATLTQKVALERNDTAALAPAMSSAVARIIEQAVTAITLIE